MSISQQQLYEKTMRIAEQYYGTASDQNQIPIIPSSQEKLERLHPQCVQFKVIHDEPVSWTVVVPTTKVLAEQFVKGSITERELFEKTVPAKVYEALYFCSVFTIRKYQRKGYATALLREAIESIPLQADPYLCAWLYSEPGAALYRALAEKFNTTVHLRTA